MVESNWPSSSATRSAVLAGASLGAELPPLAGLPPLAWAALLLAGELLAELLEALLAEALLDEALLDEELLEEALLEALLDEELVRSSSEKSTSSGGCPSLLEEGSGGMEVSSGRRSESLYTGLDGLRLRALGSGMLSLAELLRRWDSSPLRDAVLLLWLERSPDSIDGMSMLGWLLVVPGMPWLGERDELLDGMPELAVCGWLRLLLEELLEDEDELDDCDDELEDWDGCAGCCDCCCWVLQPVITALNTAIDASVRQLMPCRSLTAFRRVILVSPGASTPGLRRNPGLGSL